MKRRRAHIQPPLAPTAYGCAAAVLGGALYLTAVQTGSTACMAGALAVLLSHLVSLAVALSAFLDEKQRSRASHGNASRFHTGSRVLRAVARLAADRRVNAVYDRIDQVGRTVFTAVLEQAPRERGAYRKRSETVTVTGPLWLWRSNAVANVDCELLRPPATVDARDAVPVPATTHADANGQVDSELDTSLVRPYQRGDQLNAIAWRQSAHYGRLMSFERRRIATTTVLVVPDVDAATTIQEADALAAYALAVWNQARRPRNTAPSHSTTVLADGEFQTSDGEDAIRYCAALCPHDSKGSAPSRSDSARHPLRGPHPSSKSAPAREPLAPAAPDRAQRIIDLARVLRADRIILITTDNGSPMAHALASSDIARRFSGVEATPLELESPQHAAENATTARKRPLTSLLYGTLCGGALLYPLWLLLQAMGDMFSPGEWNATALYALGLVCAEAACMEALARWRGATGRHGPLAQDLRNLARGGVDNQAVRGVLAVFVTIALIAIAFVSVRQTLSQRTDFTLASQIFEQPAMLGPLRVAGPVGAALNVLVLGARSLYYGQWVPVSVGHIGDAALVIIWCAVAMAIRPLTLCRRTRPLVAVAPLIAQAASFQFMGEAARLPQTGLAIACGLLLAALSHAPKGSGSRETRRGGAGLEMRQATRAPGASLANAVASCAIAASIALAAASLSPTATGAAPTAPFQIVPKQGIFAGTSINPVLDLKRDLSRPGESVALIYRSSIADTGKTETGSRTFGPLYLRLSTLGSFDGATWLIRQGDTGSGRTIDQEATELSPFADAERLNSAMIGEVQTVDATITILNASSPHLPLPSHSFSIAPSVDADGADEGDEQNRGRETAAMDKLAWSPDGGAGTRDGSNVARGLTYTATCAYQEPLNAPEQLDGIANIARRLNELAASSQDGAEAPFRAQPDEGYLLLPATLPDSLQGLVDVAHSDGVPEVPGGDAADAPLDGNGLTPRQAAQIEAMRYLVRYFTSGGFTYSLDAPDENGADNLQVIANLLRERRGYCVHYASALAVLGRALGVPTRLVLGYRANAAGSSDAAEDEAAATTYRATNRDLHAWTEAYIDGVGWISFDVTPPAGQVALHANATADADKDPHADTTDNESANDPSATDDRPDGATGSGEPNGESPASNKAQADHSVLSGSGITRSIPLACGVAAALAVILAPRLIRLARTSRRMRDARAFPADSIRAVASAWAEATDSALDAGISWSRSDTEEDIARVIADALEDDSARDGLVRMSRAMCAIRYGEGRPPARFFETDLAALLSGILVGIKAYEHRARAKQSAPARASRLLAPPSLFAQRGIRQR